MDFSLVLFLPAFSFLCLLATAILDSFFLFYIPNRMKFAVCGTGGGFLGGSDGKESACNAGDLGSIPGSVRSPGEMATHSSILAWKIPWTEEPGGLQSVGLQRVRHD